MKLGYRVALVIVLLLISSVYLLPVVTTVPTWCRTSQWGHPNRNSTGRGTPVTSGFDMRGETAPVRAL